MEIKITDMKSQGVTFLLHLLINVHSNYTNNPLPLQLTGTATVVKLFITADNSSYRHGKSVKKFRTSAFFSASKDGTEVCRGDSANACLGEQQQPANVFTIKSTKSALQYLAWSCNWSFPTGPWIFSPAGISPICTKSVSLVWKFVFSWRLPDDLPPN